MQPMQPWSQKQRPAKDTQEGLVALGVENGGRIKQVRFNPSTLYAPFDVVAKRYGADADSSTSRERTARRPTRHSARPVTRTPAASREHQREALSLSVLMTALLIMVGTFHAVAMIVVETNRWLESRAQIARLERDINTIRTDMNALESQLVYRNDDGLFEQLARRQGFIYPNETRVITSFDVFE